MFSIYYYLKKIDLYFYVINYIVIMKNFYLLFIFSYSISMIESRNPMMKGTDCFCKRRIQEERDTAINKHNKILYELDKIKNITSKTFCDIGSEFSIEDTIINNKITCNKCSNNYYRSEKNSTCLHCPEGYTSEEGSSICKRNTKYTHTYCPIGKIVGSNPYGEYRNNCVKCDKIKKEYMPFENNLDKCMICPSGSIINDNSVCVKCPIGYYEQDNKCVECSSKSYNDNEGSTYCKKCDNFKSNSYYFNGGITCEDNILYKYTEDFSDYFKVNNYTNSLISSSQILNSIIYNNRKIIATTTTFTGLIGATVLIIISS